MNPATHLGSPNPIFKFICNASLFSSFQMSGFINVAIAFTNYKISIMDHLVCLNSFLHISRPATLKKLTVPFHSLLDLRLMPLCRKIRANFRKNKALGTGVKVFRLIRFMCYLVLIESYSVYMEPWKDFFILGYRRKSMKV